MSHPVLALPSPPTANGDLHVGHLAGPYLAADAFARYKRMRGHDVAYVTGADVHQSYVVGMAERLGMTPDAAADKFARRIEDTLHAADIDVDRFVRPHRSGFYQEFVREFFRRLWEAGQLVEAERPVFWCGSCRRHLLGAAVRGRCSTCGSECDGALCEHCARPVIDADLHDPRCERCGDEPGMRRLRRLSFDADRFAGRLREYHHEPRMRARSHTVVTALLAEGVPETAVSSPGRWGIDVPIGGFVDQRLDVWAEVGPGYLASTAELTKSRPERSEGWRGYWCAEDAEIVQFFGSDNTVPHALLYPALFLAHGGIRPPDRFVINAFHLLDGEKFSTSRQHAIWGSEILACAPVDGLRYYLCATASEEEQGNFTLSAFRETANRHLTHSVGPLLDEMLRAAASSEPPTLPSETGADPVRDLQERAEQLGRLLEAETFTLRGAARAWQDMAAALGTPFAQARREPLATSDPARARRRLVEALSLLASCAHPLMPGFSRRLWAALGAGDDLRTHAWGEPATQIDGGIVPPREGEWFPEVTGAQLDALTHETVEV